MNASLRYVVNIDKSIEQAKCQVYGRKWSIISTNNEPFLPNTIALAGHEE